MISAVTKSPDDTKALGAAFGSVLRSRDVVLLIGDMGAGKTTFVQGLGAGLGVDEPITSPTFVLLHTYAGHMPLHHADLYRLDHLEEVLDLGIMELIDDGGVALIEWADRGFRAFPSDVLRVELSYDENDENVRRFEMQGSGKGWAEREADLVNAIQQWIEAP
jgi:tRNA threonylcarbamoyladenosine biosynthesis protein TsaE